MMDFNNPLQFLILALSLGSLYALIAIGYTIIYGVLKLINIAHGDFFMLAGFLSMWGVLQYQLSLWIAIPAGIIITVILALLVERIAYKPLRKYKISAFTSTVAVSMIIQASVIIFFSARAKGFPTPEFLKTPIQIGSIYIPMVTPFIIVISIFLFIILSLIVNKTKLGMGMRALSLDMETVQLMGLNVDTVISFSFALSVAYAGAGAVLWGFRYPAIDPFVGVTVGLKGFICAVIGGVGSIPGALLGGFILGLAEISLIAIFPEASNFRDAFAYIIMIVFLLFRPGGIFNVKTREEKV